ncbi:MAG: hypothetical protein DWB44_09685 [Chloroflexi bacterium]|nr:hypothetical protein [Chloroflexota bacterium]
MRLPLRLTRSSFVRNTAVLMTGTFIGQVITLIATLITGRLFAPEEFGDLTFFVAWTGVFIVIASLRYEQAIVLPENEREAVSVLIVSLLLTIIIAAICSTAGLIFNDWMSEYISTDNSLFLMATSFLFVLAFGSYQALSYWAIRQKQFQRLSYSQVGRALSVAVIQISAGIINTGAEGLIVGQVAGQVVATALLALQIRHDQGDGIWAIPPTFADLRTAMRIYRRFPFYSAPQGVFNNITQNMPVYLLSIYFDRTVVGHYGLAYRLLSLPTQLIARAVRQVLFQQASAVYRQRSNFARLVIKSSLGLFALGIGPTLIIVIFGPQLFQLALGEQWVTAGQFSQWMVLWLFAGFVATPSITVIPIIDRLRMLAIWDICQFGLGSAALYLGGLSKNAHISVITFSLVGCVFGLYLILHVYLAVKPSHLYTTIDDIEDAKRDR